MGCKIKRLFLSTIVLAGMLLALTVSSYAIGQAETEERQFQTDIRFTPEELRWITEHPVLKIGAPANLEPLFISSGNGRTDGIIPDIYHLIEEKLGVWFDFVIGDMPSNFTRLQNKDIDLIGLMNRGVALEFGFSVTESPIEFTTTVFARHKRKFNIVDGDLGVFQDSCHYLPNS